MGPLGARAGDPLFLSSLYTCTRYEMFTIVQPYVYLTSLIGASPPARQSGCQAASCGLRTRNRREATMALETWIMVGDAGGIEPACTHAPDGARPHGERKDALDTVA